MAYLKKKKLYKLVTSLLPDKKIPILKNCDYKFCRGMEWLTFSGIGDDCHYYKVISEGCGNKLCIEERGCKPNQSETSVLRSDMYIKLLSDGTYEQHYYKIYE